MSSTIEHHDVVIVGAGISGIAAAVTLQRRHPGRTFAMLEMRSSLGGTWDLFRYPGIRSDSDMYTLGFAFKPWEHDKSIASGQVILDYLRETVDEHGLEPHIRLRHRVHAARWRDAEELWTLEVETSDGLVEMTCGFLYTAAGYYRYEGGYKPEIPGLGDFEGVVIHPQDWPERLDYSGQRIAVIGSGATAITLVPALAAEAAKVTMVQRSPSYVAIESDVDEEAVRLRGEVGASVAFERTRLRNLAEQQIRFHAARTNPEAFKRPLFEAIEAIVGREVREKHFTPRYEPWDQRLCLVPNGDLFHAIAEGKADVATGRIETVERDGIRMEDGTFAEADIIVTATGLELSTLGGMQVIVNGEPVDIGSTWTYRGIGFSGVPNLVNAFGYINSSWTLRIELVNEFWCDVLERMDALGVRTVVPELRPEDEGMEPRPWIDGVNSGYLLRNMGRFPLQGDRAPWLNPQVHEATKELLLADPEDGALRFGRVNAAVSASA